MLSISGVKSDLIRKVLICTACFAVSHSGVGLAQDLTLEGLNSSEPGELSVESLELQNRLEELNDRIRKLEAASKDSSKTKTKSAASTTEIPSDKWSVKLGGHFQTDFVTWANADPSIPGTQNYANFRRL